MLLRAAALVSLLMCAAPAAAQLSRIPEPTLRGSGLPKDVPGALRKAVDYVQSSLLLLFTDPGDCAVSVYRSDALEAKLSPLGDDKDRYLHRVFDIPPEGVDLSVRFSRPGYRDRTETVHMTRRRVKTLGVMLSTEYEADRVLFECPGRGGTAIAAVLPDGSDTEVVCDTDEPDWEPSVAPDGKRVAFATGPQGRRRLAVFDRETGALQVLPTGAGDDHLPRWLTDDSIVFERQADPSRVMLLRLGAEPVPLKRCRRGRVPRGRPRHCLLRDHALRWRLGSCGRQGVRRERHARDLRPGRRALPGAEARRRRAGVHRSRQRNGPSAAAVDG
jgi:hypothetical protein